MSLIKREPSAAQQEASRALTDPVPQDADLLLPREEMDGIIRYESHLEDKLERKMRQFYARRREPVAQPASDLPEEVEGAPAEESARQAAA